MTLPFFLDQPTEVTKKTLIADLMTPELTVRALRLGLIRVGDLVRAASENRLVELKLSSEDTEALKKWLEEKGLMKTRKKKAVKKDEKPLPPPNPKIVPLERIQLGLGLDGREGTNRAADHIRSLEATDDLGALKAWLAARANNRNTYGVYRKEAERFLLWCTVEREIALSSVGLEEASGYLRWLEQLGRLDDNEWKKRWRCPQSDWIGPKNLPRESPDWRPFNAPLSQASRKLTMTVIKQLFNFLKKTGYIIYNPFDQITNKVPFLQGEGAPKEFADRSFTEEQWSMISDYFESQDDSERHARLAVILMLGKGLGLRASEMLQSRAGWIVERRIDNETITVIEVVGKGDKIRRLPLQDVEMALINHYLAFRGLPGIGLCDADTPLLASLGRGRKTVLKEGQARVTALSRSGLYRTLLDFLEECALHVEENHPMDAAKFRASSTHWLRHTFATTALKQMPVNVVQNAMGHASVGTTSRYLTPEEGEVAKAMRKMKTF